MSQIALASLSPRTIAWMVYLDDWESFESIVEYNCAMRGGYYNVIVPISHEGVLSERYEGFLVGYDPDLVILPPGLSNLQLKLFSDRLHPYRLVEWNKVTDFIPPYPY